MPYYRRRAGGYNRARRSNVYRRRRTYRRRTGMLTHVPRNKFNYNRVYFFKRTVQGANNHSLNNVVMTQNTSTLGNAGQVFQINFRLDDLPNMTDFDLFNEYKILKVVMKLVPTASQIIFDPTTVGGAFAGGVIGSAITHTANPTPSGLSQMQNFQTWKWQNVYSRKTHTRVIKPTVLNVIQEDVTGADDAVSVPRRLWISKQFPSVSHYGFFVFLSDNSAATVGQTYWPQFTYYLAFRNVV